MVTAVNTPATEPASAQSADLKIIPLTTMAVAPATADIPKAITISLEIAVIVKII